MIFARLSHISLAISVATLCLAGSAATQARADADRIFQDAANFQNNGVFDLAVEEWKKFIEKHPTDRRIHDARYYLGVCLGKLTPPKYDEAIAMLSKVIGDHAKKNPKWKLAEDAYWNLAVYQYNQAQKTGKEASYKAAAKTFGELAASFEKSSYRPEALWFRGESLYAAGDKPGAIAAYRSLLEDFPKTKRKCKLLYALGATLEETAKYDEAGKVYDQFLTDCAADPLVTEVKMRKAETLLQAGLALEEKGQKGPAKKQFAAAEKLFAETAAEPNYKLAHRSLYRQALAAAKQDQFAAAAKLYAKVATDFPKSPYAKLSEVEAGRAFFSAEQYDQAATWLDKVIAAKREEAPEAAHWRHVIYLKQNKPQESVKLIESVLPAAEGGEFEVQLQLDRADALYEIAARRADAVAAYLKLVEEHPTHELSPRALYNAAYGELELKKYEQALKHAQQFLEKHADHALAVDVKFVAAESQILLKEYAAARKLYEELLEKHASHKDAENWRVRVGLLHYLDEGQNGKGKDYAKVIETLEPQLDQLKQAANRTEAQFLVGASYFHLAKFENAANYLQAAYEANPKWRKADEVLFFLARAQAKLGKNKEALANVEKLLADFPKSSLAADALYYQAEFNYAAKKYAAAAEQYGKVAEDFPKSPYAPHALYNRGLALIQAKDFKAAAESLTSLLQEHEKHSLAPRGYQLRATCRHQTGDFKGAIADIEAFLASGPKAADAADAHYLQGLCQVALTQPQAAADSFQAALKANPDLSTAENLYYELGWAHRDAGQEKKAIAVFSTLAKKFPKSRFAAEANFHVAESLYADQKYKEALPSYERARELAGKAPLGENAAYKLAWANYHLKDYEKALAAFTDQVTNYPKGKLAADGLFMRAECLFEVEQYKEALAAFEKSLENPSDNETAKVLSLLHGGQAARKIDEHEKAYKLLSQIVENHPKSPYLAEAVFEAGMAQHALKMQDEAAKLFERAAGESTGPVGARARMMVGEIYFEKKDYDQAIRHFLRVMFGYGADKAPDEIKKWQAQSGYEAARCAQVQIAKATGAARDKLIADAKRYFQYVVEKHPNSPFAREAAKQLKLLEQL